MGMDGDRREKYDLREVKFFVFLRVRRGKSEKERKAAGFCLFPVSFRSFRNHLVTSGGSSG